MDYYDVLLKQKHYFLIFNVALGIPSRVLLLNALPLKSLILKMDIRRPIWLYGKNSGIAHLSMLVVVRLLTNLWNTWENSDFLSKSDAYFLLASLLQYYINCPILTQAKKCLVSVTWPPPPPIIFYCHFDPSPKKGQSWCITWSDVNRSFVCPTHFIPDVYVLIFSKSSIFWWFSYQKIIIIPVLHFVHRCYDNQRLIILYVMYSLWCEIVSALCMKEKSWEIPLKY